jgi:hypothetical protein
VTGQGYVFRGVYYFHYFRDIAFGSTVAVLARLLVPSGSAVKLTWKLPPAPISTAPPLAEHVLV